MTTKTPCSPSGSGKEIGRDEFLKELVNLLFERNDIAFGRGKFRVRGDVVEIHPAYLDETAIRVEFFGDEIERISTIDSLRGTVIDRIESHTFFPAKQFVTNRNTMKEAMHKIKKECAEQVAAFEKAGKLIEAQRLKMRTDYDLEMMEEMGFCQGIENYSRHLTGRPPGARPYTLLDFFASKDFMLMVDESHVSIPQIGGMYEGDRSRKTVLVDHGFRLPSALDNRPLRFPEFMQQTMQRLYVSATPKVFELANSRPDNHNYIDIKRDEKTGGLDFLTLKKMKVRTSGSDESVEDFDPTKRSTPLVVEQIIRPTGLLDPVLHLKPLKGQIDETIELCRQRVEKNERVLITTLTKKTAEDLADYLTNVDLKVRYLHSDIDAVERVEILRALRAAEFDILIGINLLREGLDLPEVSLVCILDADKEGFLRNETSLIQTAGRAARHVNGECVLFCDKITDSIQKLIDVTEYRRGKQEVYNKEHGITPQSVIRKVQESLHTYDETASKGRKINAGLVAEDDMLYNVTEVLNELEGEMQEAASKLEFERAAHLRDQIKQLKEKAGFTDKDRPDKTVTFKKPARKKAKRK